MINRMMDDEWEGIDRHLLMVSDGWVVLAYGSMGMEAPISQGVPSGKFH
jgi:hypothetical protein